jgi:hypothetical protein
MNEYAYNAMPEAVAARAVSLARHRAVYLQHARELSGGARGWYGRNAKRMEKEIVIHADYLISYRSDRT